MTLSISTYQDEDGVFIAECLSIPGCVSQGASESEALKNLNDAVRECLIGRRELGMPLTLNIRQIDNN